jgi:hypothetical protein
MGTLRTGSRRRGAAKEEELDEDADEHDLDEDVEDGDVDVDVSGDHGRTDEPPTTRAKVAGGVSFPTDVGPKFEEQSPWT